jgi:UDP-galactopyranose mutase
MNKRILIIGAGFSGVTVARILAENGFLITVIDKRDHVAGNAYDYTNNKGIRVHKYGPHIFHTNNKKVFDWLSNFTTWLPYKHRVKALLKDGTEVVLPPNRETAEIIGTENIIDTLFRPYTKKMWGLEIEELDPGIINRVPIRDDDNVYYFPNDLYQGLPVDGYTKVIENILDHENISVNLNTVFSKSMEHEFFHVFNSMPIDEYYDFEFGELPYRSLKFHHQNVEVPKLLSVPTLNFTHDGKFTRVTEWKNYPGHGSNEFSTSITFEEPCDYKDNNYERYYPVKDIAGENRQIYKRYKNISNEKMTFIGRCGMYVYVDMHQAVNSAMQVANTFLNQVADNFTYEEKGNNVDDRI